MGQGKHMVFSESCDVAPEDELRVAVDPQKMPGMVGVAVFINKDSGDGEEMFMGTVFFKPANARKIAAAVLNGADSIEGIEPLESLGVADLP